MKAQTRTVLFVIGSSLTMLAVALLAGCDDDGVADDGAASVLAGPPAVSIDAPRPPDVPFSGTRWRVAGFSPDGEARRAPGLAMRYEVTFSAEDDGNTFSGFDGCRTFTGQTNPSEDSYFPVRSDAGSGEGSDIGCEGEPYAAIRAERAAIESVLSGDVFPALEGETLVLSNAAGGSLLFAAVPESTVPTTLEPKIPDGGRIDFRVLDEGLGGGLAGGENAAERFEVLRERRSLFEWRALLGPGEVDPTEPDIDFRRHVVLYASMGTRGSGGWSIEPVSVVRRDGYTDVMLQFVSPGPRCIATAQITEPWIMLELATLGQAVRVDAVDVDGPPCDGFAAAPDGPVRALDAERVAVRPLDIVPVPLDGTARGESIEGYTRVVPDRDALAALLPATPVATALLDDIDFDAETIVDVAFGFAPSSGHDIRVADARNGDSLVLDVLSVVPGDGCAVDQGVEYPRRLARLPLAGQRVVFIERTEANAPCKTDG